MNNKKTKDFIMIVTALVLLIAIVGIWTGPEGIRNVIIVYIARRTHCPNVRIRIVRIEVRRRQAKTLNSKHFLWLGPLLD